MKYDNTYTVSVFTVDRLQVYKGGKLILQGLFDRVGWLKKLV